MYDPSEPFTKRLLTCFCLQFGNTCYCNSILQCLYYSVPFRENVLNFPKRSALDTLQAAAATAAPRPPINTATANGSAAKKAASSTTARNPGAPVTNAGQKPEDKDSPEYKKKQALIAGPILNMTYENLKAYDMPESLFTAMKDIFEQVIANQSRIGVVAPHKFLEILRRENEMFRTAMHQDAHEFLNLLLNEVLESVEAEAKKLGAGKDNVPPASPNGTLTKSMSNTVSFPSSLPAPSNGASTTRWVHELFEGTLTSETRCLTCENVSQRDEAFLDLSVDLESHTSVTACLRRFSEEEMLCERNKFHCDNCGGLQEAEKRMKIKRLPKILALHLKRFKYTEDLQRLQKLFYKVVYPYHLRLFNTTNDAEDPDRLYELYAVVVHIGGGPYHGHYVAIIKTEDRGWLLFDDEMVEPVDKSFVRNFFGDRPGLAAAYVLFYQETTLEAVQRELEKEGKPHVAEEDIVGLGMTSKNSAELHRVATTPTPVDAEERYISLDHAATAPQFSSPANGVPTALPNTTPTLSTPTPPSNHQPATQKSSENLSKKDRAREEKERKAAQKEDEKARKAAEKAAEKERAEAEKTRRKESAARLLEAQKKQDADLEAAMKASKLSKAEEDRRTNADGTEGTNKENVKENGTSTGLGGLSRWRKGSRSISHKLGSIGKSEKPPPPLPTVDGDENNPPSATQTPEKDPEKKNRFSLRKKSFTMLS
ncbi:MAG: hypothetical protein Q9227_002429 [Pyrenula ochraceoflavens]